MRRTSHVLVGAVLLILGAAGAGVASMVAPPPNLGSLAQVSRAVVFAEAAKSWSELRGGTPYTITEFRVVDRVKGESLAASLEVERSGGTVGDVSMIVLGAPEFTPGERYLLFLDPAGEGRWRPKMAAYGILREDKASGLLRPVSEAEQLQVVPRPGIEPIGTYRKQELLLHLSSVAHGATPWYAQAVEAEAALLQEVKAASSGDIGFAGQALHNKPASCSVVTSGGFPVRWFGFEKGGAVDVWHTTPGQAGISDGGVSAIQSGAAAWKGLDTAVVNLNYAGSRPATFDCSSGSAFQPDNEIIFNDPCGQLPELSASCPSGFTPPGHWTSPCCGLVAEYGVYADSSSVKLHDNENWRQLQSFSVVVNNGSQCVGEVDFQEVVTHFLGHAAGFGHHDDPNATMYGQLGVHASRGAALSQTDQSCANYAYHTFVDVPRHHWSWGNIEAIENAGITKGCSVGSYCPLNKIQRAEMGVFLVRGMHGADFVPPPATGAVFSDVPADHWAAPHIEQLFRDGITKGCGVNPARYCPAGLVTRAEMATFLVRVKHGADFTPPAAEGTFEDVAPSYWAAAHIEQIYEDGVSNGCQASPLRYCPTQHVIREQMAAFLARIFDLAIPLR